MGRPPDPSHDANTLPWGSPTVPATWLCAAELQWVCWGPESPPLHWSRGPRSWQPPSAGSPPSAALVNVKASGRHCARPCLSLPTPPPPPCRPSARGRLLFSSASQSGICPAFVAKKSLPLARAEGQQASTPCAARPWARCGVSVGHGVPRARLSPGRARQSSSAASRLVRCPHHVLDRSLLYRESSVPSVGWAGSTSPDVQAPRPPQPPQGHGDTQRARCTLCALPPYAARLCQAPQCLRGAGGG